MRWRLVQGVPHIWPMSDGISLSPLRPLIRGSGYGKWIDGLNVQKRRKRKEGKTKRQSKSELDPNITDTFGLQI